MAARTLDFIVNTQNGQLLSGFNSATQAPTQPSFVFGDTTPVSVRLVEPSGSSDQPWSDIDLTGKSVRIGIGSPGGYPTAGTFTLTYGANTTTALSFDSTAAQVSAALNLLASIISAGGVSVSSTAAGSYRIVFTTVGVTTAITGNSTSLYPTSTAYIAEAQTGSASVQAVFVVRLEVQPAAYAELADELPVAAIGVSTVRAGGTGVAEIQRIIFNPIPFGGVYTLAYATVETADLQWDATADDIQTALRAKSGTEADLTNVSVTGTFPIFNVTFSAAAANADLLVATSSALLVPTGRKGEISLNTTGVVELLAGSSRADVTIEIEIVDDISGETWTPLQATAVLREDVIPNSPASQTTGPVYLLESIAESRYVRYDSAQTLTAANKLQAVTNLGFTTNKATIANGDKITILDSAATDAPKHVLWSLIVSTLTTAFNALYVGLTGNQTIAGDKTFSGVTVFTSTTRPTSSGTGTPAATSLITLTDNSDQYLRRTLLNLTTNGWNFTATGSALIDETPDAFSLYMPGAVTGTGLARGNLKRYFSLMRNESSAYNQINWGGGRFRVSFSFFLANVASDTIFRFQIGEDAFKSTITDIDQKGIGIKITGTNLVCVVHDGTTLTNSSATVIGAGTKYDVIIESTGSGSVLFYLNGTLIHTATAGPTGYSSLNKTAVNASIDNGASTGVIQAALWGGIRFVID